MPRTRNTRLTRVAVSAAGADSPATLDCLAIEGWAALAAVVRDGLLRAGIDPAVSRALSSAPALDPAAAETKAEPCADFFTSDSDGLAASFAAKLANLMRTYQDGREPDFVNASLAELLAWCLSRASHPPVESSA
jgi:hypothetical protein